MKMSRPKTNITCQALACSNLLHSTVPFVHTRSSNTQISVNFNPHKYCSFGCYDHGQRIRHLYRIERMIYIFFLEYSDTTNPFLVLSDRVIQERYGNWRQIVALGRADYPGTVSLRENNLLSLRGRLAFLSMNSCTTVLTVFAAMMAYLCKDLDPSINIHEAHVDNVLSDQEVHALFLSEDGSLTNAEVAGWHSMFRITAANEDDTTVPAEPTQLNGTGIYCDTTAAQYGRVAGLQDATAYHRRHPNSKTVYYTSLGYYRRMRHLTDVDPNSAESVRHHILALRKEAYIRTMNNVVHEEIEGMGGCAQLLAMTSANFEAAYTNIAARLQSALFDLAVELHDLYSNLPPGMVFESMENADRYQVVADRCMGAGHGACLRALEERAPDTWAYADGRLRFFNRG